MRRGGGATTLGGVTRIRSLREWTLDLLIVGVAATAQAELWLSADSGSRPLVSAVGLVATLALLARRVAPLGACLVAFAAAGVSIVLAPNGTLTSFGATLLAFWVAGRVNRPLEAVVAWLAGCAVVVYASWFDPYGGGLGDFLLTMAIGTGIWLTGLALGNRSRRTAVLERRVEAAERAREQAAQQAVAAERAVIARELHDLVAHSLSVIIIQALAAQQSLEDGGGAEPLRARLTSIESTSRQALGEMRRLLGILRPDGHEAELTPAPGLASLSTLVQRLRSADVPVELVSEGAARPLEPGVDLSAYRIVQEALTNTLKHAAATCVRSPCATYRTPLSWKSWMTGAVLVRPTTPAAG